MPVVSSKILLLRRLYRYTTIDTVGELVGALEGRDEIG